MSRDPEATVRGAAALRTVTRGVLPRSSRRRPDPAAARLRVLARWGFLAGRREFAYSTLHTAQGRIALAVSLLALLPIWQIVRNGGNVLDRFAAPEVTEAFRLGGILLGEVGLLLGFLLFFPVTLVKEFIVDRGKSPLLAHPFARPEEAVLRFLTTLLRVSVFLWTSFHIFYLNLLLHGGGGTRWPGLVLHLAAGFLFLLPFAVGMGSATRLLLRAPRIGEHASRYFHAGLLPFLVGYPLFLLLPNLLASRAPGILEFIGAGAGPLLYLFQLPAAIWLATVEAAWGRLLALLALLLAAGWWGARVLWRWRIHAPAELTLEVSAPRPRHAPLPFLGSASLPRWWRDFRLFWIKDTVAPFLRSPGSWLRIHWILLGWAVFVPVTARQAVSRGALDPAMAEVLPVALLLLLAGAVAMRAAVGRFGVEGPLRPILGAVLSPGGLLAAKSAGSVAETALTLFPYPIVIAAASWSPGVGLADTLIPGLVALLFGVILALFGTILGALLPGGAGRREGPSTGASTAARVLFTGVGALGGFPLLGALTLHALGFAEGATLALFCGFSLAVPLGAGLLLLPLALRRRTDGGFES